MNKVMLIGNVGKEPEVRYYDKDQAMAQFSLATTDRGYTLPNGTVVPDRTEWHRVVMYRKLAKVAERFIHRGDKIYVEGKIRYRSFDDKRGVRHNYTEIQVDNMELLSTKMQGGGVPLSQPMQESQQAAPQPYSDGAPSVPPSPELSSLNQSAMQNIEMQKKIDNPSDDSSDKFDLPF